MSGINITNQDAAKAEKIRRQYLSREENKMEQLKRLDDKVKAPGKVVAGIMGTIGALAMGGGMSYVMVWNEMTTGLILSIPGLLVMLLAYPVYRLITGKRKKKYAGEIINLSEKLTSEE